MLDISHNTRKKLIELGTLRVCRCGFETLDRKEFRRHLMDSGRISVAPKLFNHSQDFAGRKEAVKYSDEEIAARKKAKYGNKV